MSWKGWETKEMDAVLRDLRKLSRKVLVFDCLDPYLLSRVKESKFQGGHEYYVIPLLSHDHYVLFILHPKLGAVFYVDSLDSYFPESRVDEWLALIERVSKMRISKWASLFDKPVQEDENTCGAYVAAAVKAVLTKEPHDWPRATLEYVDEMKRLLNEKSLRFE